MRASKGFTLIELAVVIAIVAILAAVAVPRLVDSTASAERAVALDFVSQLNSAAAMYTAKQMVTPGGFANFVTNAAIPAGSKFTISTATLGDGGCGAPPAGNGTLNCTGAFNKLTSATYTWTDGAITSNIAP